MEPESANRENFARERELLLRALERPPNERPGFLDDACAGNPALRQRLDALLAHHREDSFLDRPAAELAAISQGTLMDDAAPGSHVGRYKLLEKLGEGGCGVVYLAEQEEPVRRRVALKIIKPGINSRQVIARFEAERLALALMEHSSIAEFYDAGLVGSTERAKGRDQRPEVRGQTSESRAQRAERAEGHGAGCQTPDAQPLTSDPGRPYFVIELVRGIRITDYCAQKNLSTRERLDLFVQVCYAVQHAHVRSGGGPARRAADSAEGPGRTASERGRRHE